MAYWQGLLGKATEINSNVRPFRIFGGKIYQFKWLRIFRADRFEKERNEKGTHITVERRFSESAAVHLNNETSVSEEV